jgi:acrylyl-CoA reductase (NADPH)/3-hydroxypropionyl-CoA dehydratase/3-hydroxypropionyl-CoA synthetase
MLRIYSSDSWRGDIDRFTEVYFNRWDGELTYTQGDYARQHDEGAFHTAWPFR